MKLGFAVQISLALRCEKSDTVPSAAYIEKGSLFPSSPEKEGCLKCNQEANEQPRQQGKDRPSALKCTSQHKTDDSL